MKILKESKNNEIEVEEVINHRKRTKRNKKLLQQEYLLRIDTYLYYLEDKVLEQAEIHLLREIKDVEQSIDPEHVITLQLKDSLSIILKGQGRWEKAEKLQLQVLEIFKRTLGAEHSDTDENNQSR